MGDERAETGTPWLASLLVLLAHARTLLPSLSKNRKPGRRIRIFLTGAGDRRGACWQKPVVLGCSLILSCAAVSSSCAQTAARLPLVRKLYIDQLGTDGNAVATRDDIIRRLQKSRDIQVVPNVNEADAVMNGTAQIWAIGHISLTRSHSVSEAVLEGFLSVEVVGKDKQTLWSYLVTPGKFPQAGVSDDLARQLVSKLLAAVKEGSQPEPSVSNAPGKFHATLRGAGATFPAPLYQKWFESFQELHPDVKISYDPVGSAEGIRRLERGQVDFGASEMPLSLESAHPAPRQVPMALGAVVPIYNVNHLGKLNFTAEILAGIYLGKIKKWNDSQIRKANPDRALPDATIVVIHRSEGSGTTFVWTDYLSKVSADWRTLVGTGVTVQWPTGMGAVQNEGVASAVEQNPNSIGYVEFIYAIQHELGFGAVRNAAGRFIKADIPSVAAAAQTPDQAGPSFRFSITASPGKASYPIASYTWLLVPDQIEDHNKKGVLEELLHWMLTSGQKSCSALGYVPLPTGVVKQALESVDQIR
jgi:phosphate transport system substrate-binding protein